MKRYCVCSPFVARAAQLVLLLSAASNWLPPASRAAEIYLGSGAKAGEVADKAAIVHVRLTSTPGQDAQGLIPGRAGLARLKYGLTESLDNATTTDWREARAEDDYSIQFKLQGLQSAKRYFYRVEMKTAADAAAESSDVYSFVTAPAPTERLPVKFHLTTCQDLHGSGVYVHMAKQRPDFCVSAGDTVYYDGQGLSRTPEQAYQAYQQMFGLPPMKDYYRHVGSYFMKDDHDYRFNDCDPHMKGLWVNAQRAERTGAKLTERRGNQGLDVAWMTAEEGARVQRTVFPMSEKPYRTFRWGRGVQIWLLENREFRSPNAMPDGPEKSIWGKQQKAWLEQTLLASDADHRIIISPNPIMGPDRLMKGDNQANLNGFWHEGQAFLDWLKDRNLTNVILMCGDRHWQYHSIDHRNGRDLNEFSCGPTFDDHVQPVPPVYEGIDRPYSASRGGFLAMNYEPDGKLSCQFFSQDGQPLYEKVFQRNVTK